ncbi:juvenile hormone acid O-methyltransferase-like [Anticarsia gemmatalis]|uniref:juvenile hormone acid O-methyltransferase-like n=1 Tax=Anticarsia gemmatalis TaxID=129554 RepID=UPI001EA48662|nr:juvenile hormone acid methyltransferase [Anticarsia gemmatalis]
MNKPELYNASNEIQRESAFQCLSEYAQRIKWNKTGDTAIDIGCGDGSVSVIVKKFTPYSYKKFVACDISEQMVKFASQRYGDEDIAFRVLNIEGEIPQELTGAFNHVFSFYALHWVKNQEKAFRNIHKLLTDDGDCFVTFLGSTAIYSVYNILANNPKWKAWLKNVDIFISPYHDMKNPEVKVAEIMKKCGFKNVDVQCREMTSVFDSEQALKNLVHSVEPFDMPNDVFDEFAKDYLTVGQEIGVMSIDSKTKSVTYTHSLIVACANK